ncbi:TPR-like protein [Lindgomyces ingoldianus]|uniref:TPR-like protein n=1 Tax=Lindgomyces ingoldianus TaxID=673940 RepID=A0ACB6QIP9_9PLEO|nr:TPR-like protein [Lindgomyces ingoldianus]KAF2466818.1 TPR-like protein [Lindgomyces ingoldianus]
MDLRGGLFNPWTGQQLFNNGQFPPSQFQARQYTSPYATHQQPPQIPLTSSGFQGPLGVGYVSSGPVIHEGFIPAPGHEDDDEDEAPYPSLPAGYRKSLFHRYNLGSDDEDDSDEERRLAEDEERLLRQIADKEDLQEEADPDFDVEDVEEVDDLEEELLTEEEFDEELDGEEEEDKEETRRPRSTGRGNKASRERGRARAADPGPQFKELQQKANEAFLRQDFLDAIDYANKAVQMNPEIFTAHNLLSEIYMAMAEEQKAVEALIVGAPTKRDKSLWFHIIDRVQDMDTKKYPLFTPENKTAIILDCLRSILILDANDYEARSQKLKIETELGHVSRVITLCRKMLTIRPYDIDVLKQMARMGVSSPKQTQLFLKRMIHSFDTSIAYFIANDKPSDSNLDWSLLNLYLDLLDRAGDPAHSLKRLKTLSRWIQGRKDETYWDNQDDDREFDVNDRPRRVTVPEFGTSTKARYGKTLPFELRIKMGEFRLRLQPPDINEAMQHFEMLEPEDDGYNTKVMDYGDLFRDAADALHAAGYDAEALRFYEPLYNKNPDEMIVKTYAGLHSCYQNLGNLSKAEEITAILLDWETENLEDLTTLAKFFEDNNMDDEALRRAEFVYLNGGSRLLRDIGFLGYVDMQDRFVREKRRRPRKKYKPRRKTRVESLFKNLKNLAMGLGEPTNNKQSSFTPTTHQRPREGLFRARKSATVHRLQTFLPPEKPTFKGTDVRLDSTDQRKFQKKLDRLASDFTEDLKATRAQHREIVASFERLEHLTEAADEGDKESSLEWMSIARELMEEFFTFDLFYTGKRREAFQGYFRKLRDGDLWRDSALMVLAVAANKIEDGEESPEIKQYPSVIPEDFYGVHFHMWLDVICQYAVLCARQGDCDRCFSTIDMAFQANVFYRHETYSLRLQMCRIGCAVALEDSKQSSIAVRWLMKTFTFGNDPFRLYSTVNRLCPVHDGFNTDATLKAFLRYVKAMDHAIMTPEQRDGYNFDNKNDRSTRWMTEYVLTEGTENIKEHDPVILTAYAHVLMSGGSYVAALNYYFRALAISPEDPVLNLCIGLAYIQHGMKRLSENRQFQIQQGLAFTHRYYTLRTRDDIALHISEAEFNVGRVWHALGLTSLALPAYERCIALSVRVRNEENTDLERSFVENFETEAAFAIQSILAMAGDFEGARVVTEAVLVME